MKNIVINSNENYEKIGNLVDVVIKIIEMQSKI